MARLQGFDLQDSLLKLWKIQRDWIPHCELFGSNGDAVGWRHLFYQKEKEMEQTRLPDQQAQHEQLCPTGHKGSNELKSLWSPTASK